MMFIFSLLMFVLSCADVRADAVEDLKNVLERRLTTAENVSGELHVAATYDRVRKWLPSAPQVNYWNNDSNTWKAWSISTSMPYPKAFLRNRVDASEKSLRQAEARSNKQELFRKTLDVFLDCAIPSELENLMRAAMEDQEGVSRTLDSLYSYGKVPQSDRVSAQLTLRQLEAQVKMYEAQSRASCERWEDWAGIPNDTEDPKMVPTDLENAFLMRVGLESDHFRDVTQKKLVNVSLGRDGLWTKYVPEIDFMWSKNNYFDLVNSGGPPHKYTTSWSVGITLPLAFPDYKREKAELGLAMMQAELEKTEAEKNWEQAKDDWKRISWRLNQIWKSDSAVTDVLVESTLSSYRNGKTGFAELALARRTRLDLKIEEIQLKAERLVAKATCLTECE